MCVKHTNTAPEASSIARKPLSLDTLPKMKERRESSSMESSEVSSVLVWRSKNSTRSMSSVLNSSMRISRSTCFGAHQFSQSDCEARGSQLLSRSLATARQSQKSGVA